MSATRSDVIDFLAGIEPGSPLDGIRNQRTQARENAQRSYQALFEPEIPGGVTALERYAIAAFVAGLHRQAVVADFYAAGLRKLSEPGISGAIAAEISRGALHGPYGRYPEGPLSAENIDGPDYHVSPDTRSLIGGRLAAALEHSHLLAFHPRDANPATLQNLLDARWSATDIVTLSQLVSFLAFQIRVVAGLRALATASAEDGGSADTTPITSVLASSQI